MPLSRPSLQPFVLALALICGACSPPPDRIPSGPATDALPWADAAVSPDAAPLSPPPPRVHIALSPGTYVVLAQDDLVDVAEELAGYRRGQGYTTQVHTVSELVGVGGAARTLVLALRSRLDKLAEKGPVHLALLGDAPGPGEATVGRIPALPCDNLYGGCWTDNAYGDLDEDGLPDLAVGRIPARSAAQARGYLARLKTHEGRYEPGPWNRRLSLYTGKGDFGAQADAAIELGMMEGLKRVDHAFDIVGAYNNATSPYYYKPFSKKVVDLFNQGNLFVIYVGHGMSNWTSGLSKTELEAIHCAHRAPGVFLIACFTGDYLGPDDSVAEALLAKDDGAIVAFASTDVSHPYGNGVLLYELTRVLLGWRPGTYGLGLLQAKREMMRHTDEFRELLDAVASMEVPTSEQATVRAQHLDLYNLLGDPATRIAYPRTAIVFDPVGGAFKDGRLVVSGSAPGIDQGQATVTLELERDVMLHPLEPVDPSSPDEATVQANWSKAVDKVVAETVAPVAGESFVAGLSWTPPLPGRAFYVKVYAQSASADSFGVVRVQ